ncbi:hypothetical protein [Kurthia gibsonii]|uniref:hypothetical protein n=1 Tax=Kurthia gibsonii TaxID=33946 RepID=UPI0031B714DE
MPSLTENIELLYTELHATEPQPITNLLLEVKNKNGELHKNYPSGWKFKRVMDIPSLETLDHGGIYVFWWLNDSPESLQPLFAPDCTRTYSVKGKKVVGEDAPDVYHSVEIEWTDAWLTQYQGHIPLYVGKSADRILKRMALHLQIHQAKYTGKATSDQLRRGMERLFQAHVNTADIIVNHVGFSYISLHGIEHVVNRFYLEDYAIGKLMPLFNVDIKR